MVDRAKPTTEQPQHLVKSDSSLELTTVVTKPVNPSNKADWCYRASTVVAALAIALPAIKLIGLIIAGTALTITALTPIGWALLIGGAALFALSTTAYVCCSKSDHRAKEVFMNLLAMILIPAAVSGLMAANIEWLHAASGAV